MALHTVSRLLLGAVLHAKATTAAMHGRLQTQYATSKSGVLQGQVSSVRAEKSPFLTRMHSRCCYYNMDKQKNNLHSNQIEAVVAVEVVVGVVVAVVVDILLEVEVEQPEVEEVVAVIIQREVELVMEIIIHHHVGVMYPVYPVVLIRIVQWILI